MSGSHFAPRIVLKKILPQMLSDFKHRLTKQLEKEKPTDTNELLVSLFAYI